MSKPSAVPPCVAFLALLLFAPALWAQPVFSKAFSPATIGPGSSSTLTFTINNEGGADVTNLAFVDVLPAGVVISDPAIAVSTCDGTISAPAGGSTISFSDGVVASGATCTVRVEVTSSTAGTYTNISGDLTSSDGNSGPASADLTVNTSFPGFSKSFSPSTVGFGARSTLTFTIDNNTSQSAAQSLTFSDSLPTGMVVADPSGVTNSCNGTLNASEGSGTISLSGGFVPPGELCTISLDVETSAVGVVVNSSGNLTGTIFSPSFMSITSGHANAALTVNAGDLILVKNFVDDPVPPGGTAVLQFTILNRSRTETATGLTFTDDLDATLTGLVATGLPASDVCGAGSTLSGTSLLTLTGGELAPEASCSFDVTLQVPAGAAPGNYLNTTSPLTGDLGGIPVVISPATDPLFVQPVPSLTKTFTDDPVIAGGTVTAEFTITNTSPTDPATGINFTDNLTAFATGTTVSALPPAGFCGAGSNASQFSGGSGEIILNVTGANLAAGGSCTFQVSLDLSAGLNNNTYTNTTSPITATVGGETVQGAPASDAAQVVAAPRLTKAFTDDPVNPGAMATLEFLLELDVAALTDATDVSFTDDLNAALTGLTAVTLPAGGFCGAGSMITGTSNLTVSGVTVPAGGSCTFSVMVQVPAGATPGTYVNTTSAVSATVGGLAVTGAAASEDLDINGLTLSKSFTDDPGVAGGAVNLRFVISNAHPVDAANGITFTDDLDAVLPGLISTAGVVAEPCGTGSQLSGTNLLTLTGGSIDPGDRCVIDVPLQLPAGAAPGEYVNVTSSITANGGTLTGAPASDRLAVAAPLTGSKTFIDDPVRPGDSATLRFTLENTSSSATVDSIAFTDDLNSVMAGLVATGLPLSDVCGVGSTLSGTSVLTLSGGQLAAGTSCTFDVALTVPLAAGTGVYTNSTSDVTASVSGTPFSIGALSDDLVITQAVSITKTFTDDPVERGGTATLEFLLENLSSTFAATDVTFTDDLDAAMVGMIAVGLPQSDVCGAGSTLSGTSVLALTGGSLPASGSCTVSVTVQLPADAPLGSSLNTTSGVTATIDSRLENGPADSDSIVVVGAPTLTKAFAGPAAAGGTIAVEFTLSLAAGAPASATGISFSDDLDAVLTGLVATGLPRSNVCGAGSTLTGTGTITLADGVVPPDGSCTFSVTLQVPADAATGTYLNTTSAVAATMSGVAVTEAPAADNLQIVEAPSITKTFTDDPVVPGDSVTVEFTITNGNLADAATAISFTDDLDAAAPGLVATGLPVADVCGAGSQLSGTSVLTLTGGTLAAGGSCTFTTTLQVAGGTAPGDYVNTTSALSAAVAGAAVSGAPAQDTLGVITPLAISKTFTSDPVSAGGTATLEFTLTNTSPTTEATSVTFTDDLDAVVTGLVATGLPAADVCGVGSTLSGTSLLTLTGGTIPAGGDCTFSVTLDVPDSPGTYNNVTSLLSGALSGTTMESAAPATDTLTLTTAPVVTKTFIDDPVAAGGTATLELTISLAASAPGDATAISFTDDLDATLSGLVATGLPATGICGAGSQISGTGVISFTGGSLVPGSSCTFQIVLDVPAGAAPGVYTNTTSDVSATMSGAPVTAAGASDDLIVAAPAVLTKSFLDDPAIPGGTVELQFTITNPNPTEPVTDLAFTDDLDAALTGLVATGLPAADVCGVGSTLSGTSLLTLAGGTIPAGGDCTFSVTLNVPDSPGTYDNVTSLLTGTLFGAPMESAAPATDTLTVTIAPVVTKTFIDDPVAAGGTATLELTISLAASAPADATAISFTDDLDGMLSGLVATGLPASDVCGTGSQISGTGVISFTGGSLVPGSSCTFQIVLDVPAGAAPGVYTNTTSDVSATMSGAPVTAAGGLDDLMVVAPAVLTKSFVDDPAIPGGTVELQFTVTNPNPIEPITDIAFTDDLDAALAGLVATGLPVSDVCGAGSTLTGTDVISLSGGSLVGGGSCTFSVTLDLPPGIVPGPPVTNITSPIEGVIAGTGFSGEAATDELLIDYLQFSKEFSGEAPPGGTVRLRFTIVNPDPTSSVSGIGFTDDLDAVLPGLVAIGLPRNDLCGFASTVSGTSVITLTNGSLGPGETCTFTVDLQIPADAVAGDYVNITSGITAGLFGAGSAAEAALVINPAVAGVAVIPTLGTWMLLLMAALLAGVALIKMS